MVLFFDGQCYAQPFPSSAVEQLLWVAPEYERQHKCLLENGAAGRQGVVRIAEEVQVSCRCEFEASPTHAIWRVENEGIGWMRHGEEGRDLQKQGWNTTVEPDEC